MESISAGSGSASTIDYPDNDAVTEFLSQRSVLMNSRLGYEQFFSKEIVNLDTKKTMLDIDVGIRKELNEFDIHELDEYMK